MIDSTHGKRTVGLMAVVLLTAGSVLGSGCSTLRSTGDEHVSQDSFKGGRSPASTATVLRKLMVEATEDGSEWLVRLLGKGPEAEALAGRVRNGLSTLKPSEIRDDERLIRILSKDVAEVTEDDARYLLDIASNRAVSLANCAECVIRRKQFLGYRKIIRERMMKASGSDAEAKRHVIGFLKRAEVLLDKGVVEPKKLSEFIRAINVERFKGAEVAPLLDTVQAMVLAVGKDLDPKAAAEIVNNWPDSSLRGLRKFYSEVVLAQAADGLDVDAAAETVLKRLNVVDAEEIKVMKVCSLIRR